MFLLDLGKLGSRAGLTSRNLRMERDPRHQPTSEAGTLDDPDRALSLHRRRQEQAQLRRRLDGLQSL